VCLDREVAETVDDSSLHDWALALPVEPSLSLSVARRSCRMGRCLCHRIARELLRTRWCQLRRPGCSRPRRQESHDASVGVGRAHCVGVAGAAPTGSDVADNSDRPPRHGAQSCRVERITVDSAVMGGVPCLRGLRIPVATVVNMVAGGMTAQQIVDELPPLEIDDIAAALSFAADAVADREIPLQPRA